MAELQHLRERPVLQGWARATQDGGLPRCVLPMCATCPRTPEDCKAFFVSLEKHVEKHLTDFAASKGRSANEIRVYCGITIKSGAGRIATHMGKTDYSGGTIVYMDTPGLDVDLSAHTIRDMDEGKVAELEPVYKLLRGVERHTRQGVFHRMNTVLINSKGSDGAVVPGRAYLATPLDKAVMTCYFLYLEKDAALPGATRETTQMSWAVGDASRHVAVAQEAAAPLNVLQDSADRTRALFDYRRQTDGYASRRRSAVVAAAVDGAMRRTNAEHAAQTNSAAATPPQVSPPQQQTDFKRAPGCQPCKFGAQCYQTSRRHWEQFDHPDDHAKLATQQVTAPLPHDPPVPAAAVSTTTVSSATFSTAPVPAATFSTSALSMPTAAVSAATVSASASASASASTQRPFQGMIEEGPQTGYIMGSEMGRWAKRQKPLGSDYGAPPRGFGGHPTAPFPNTNPLSLPEPTHGWYTGSAKAANCPVGTMWLDTTNPWLRLIRKNSVCACATCRKPRCVSWASTQPYQLKPNPTQPNPSPPPCDLPELERSTKCTPCSWRCSGILTTPSSELGRACPRSSIVASTAHSLPRDRRRAPWVVGIENFRCDRCRHVVRGNGE
jgi:hypothetical protein